MIFFGVASSFWTSFINASSLSRTSLSNFSVLVTPGIQGHLSTPFDTRDSNVTIYNRFEFTYERTVLLCIRDGCSDYILTKKGKPISVGLYDPVGDL